jgi:hypothetical protein
MDSTHTITYIKLVVKARVCSLCFLVKLVSEPILLQEMKVKLVTNFRRGKKILIYEKQDMHMIVPRISR